MTLDSIPPAGVAGDQPSDFKRIGNFTAPRSSRRVSPSLQVTGNVYFSVWTSIPAARNAATPHSTALAISGVPVTRPPTSSVSRRRFSSIGEEPMIMGRSLAAASVQAEASVTEQPAAACGATTGWSESFFGAGICAATKFTEKAAATKKYEKRIAKRSMSSGLSDLKKSVHESEANYIQGAAISGLCLPRWARSVFWRVFRVEDAIGDPRDLRHFADVVHTDDVRAGENAGGDAGGGA